LDGTMFTSFFNSGQICTSGSRLLLEESIADEFLDELEQRMRDLTVGDPRSDETQLGPLISDEQRARVEGYIESALEAGAAVRVGGGRPPLTGRLRHGYFVQPTLLVSVDQAMRVAREEIFGPVLSVLRFRTEEEAVEIANDVVYGLAATVWTTTLDRAMRMSQRLDAGIIWTNCPHHLTWQTPYEGHRDSGLGEDLGLEAINTFTTLKVNYVHFGNDRFGWA
jgi:acyl-CoA reductase-like NAD-dependent aldehyde dehydrogenase